MAWRRDGINIFRKFDERNEGFNVSYIILHYRLHRKPLHFYYCRYMLLINPVLVDHTICARFLSSSPNYPFQHSNSDHHFIFRILVPSFFFFSNHRYIFLYLFSAVIIIFCEPFCLGFKFLHFI